jgi:outer membrane lipoprotein-sorting protein
MPFRSASASLLLVCLTAFALSSCVVRRRVITHAGAGKTRTLLTADPQALAGVLARRYNAIQDFSATVDMVPALGSAEKNEITEYKDVRAYILFRKPEDIRIVGLYPVVRNKLFDMVSTGSGFKLYIAPKNRFVVGPNDVAVPSKNKLENLRPRHFLDALLVRPIASDDKVLLENFTDEDDAFYILHVVREPQAGELRLSRTIWFSRLDLQLVRQLILDDAGNILTDARYSQWKPYDNVPFPKHIEINRPEDEYGVVIDIVKMDINKGVSDDKFVLQQPPGTRLQDLSRPAATAGSPDAPPASPRQGPRK